MDDIFEQTNIPGTIVGQPVDPENAQPHFAPAPIEEVVKTIMAEKPAVVCTWRRRLGSSCRTTTSSVATAVRRAWLICLDCIEWPRVGGHERNWRRCYFVRSAKGLDRSGVFEHHARGKRPLTNKKHERARRWST